MLYFLLTLTFLLGGLIPMQGVVNASLGQHFQSPFIASFTSFFVGLCAITVICLLNRASWPSIQIIASTPWYLWIGGLLGVVFVTSTLILIPKIGVATFLGTAIAGQLLVSVIIDHFGAFGLAQHPINIQRIMGVIFLLIGMVLIQVF